MTASTAAWLRTRWAVTATPTMSPWRVWRHCWHSDSQNAMPMVTGGEGGQSQGRPESWPPAVSLDRFSPSWQLHHTGYTSPRAICTGQGRLPAWTVKCRAGPNQRSPGESMGSLWRVSRALGRDGEGGWGALGIVTHCPTLGPWPTCHLLRAGQGPEVPDPPWSPGPEQPAAQ